MTTIVKNDIPRRARIDQFAPAEKSIYDAVQAVEAMAADVRLTDAVVLLQAARDSVADFIDGIDQRRYVTQSSGAAGGPKDITKESAREYDYGGRVYRINQPQKLWIGTTTHRVLDLDGVVHCCPAPGVGDCALRWYPKDAAEPVQF